MTQEDKDKLLKLLKKADEEGLLSIYDAEGTSYETDWIFMDSKIIIKIKEF